MPLTPLTLFFLVVGIKYPQTALNRKPLKYRCWGQRIFPLLSLHFGALNWAETSTWQGILFIFAHYLTDCRVPRGNGALISPAPQDTQTWLCRISEDLALIPLSTISAPCELNYKDTRTLSWLQFNLQSPGSAAAQVSVSP